MSVYRFAFIHSSHFAYKECVSDDVALFVADGCAKRNHKNVRVWRFSRWGSWEFVGEGRF